MPRTSRRAGRSPQSGKLGRFFRDPLSVVLAGVIVVALVIAALLGGELYARSRADTIVAGVVECVVQDDATATFAALPPFLVQFATKHYSAMHIETAGNQLREAKGMKLALTIDDVRLQDSADSAGTIGSMTADVSWSADGIKQTIQGAIPLIGGFITEVTTSAADGTIELRGPLGTVVAKPEIVDGGIALQAEQVTGLGLTLPHEAAQPALDAFTKNLTQNYPMDIQADSVQVTDSGVTSSFSARNSTIPKQSQDRCFGNF